MDNKSKEMVMDIVGDHMSSIREAIRDTDGIVLYNAIIEFTEEYSKGLQYEYEQRINALTGRDL